MNISVSKLPKILTAISIIYILILFAFASGLVNSMIEGSRIPEGTFLVPIRSIQSIAETITSVFILSIGTGGIFLLYSSTTVKSEKTRMVMMTVGIIIIGISLLIGYRLVDLKS
jgi:hypothetical protein